MNRIGSCREICQNSLPDRRHLGPADPDPALLHFQPDRQKDPPPITHPAFFYGFIGAALAWQFAFFVIATDPTRYRPLMIPSVFEKFSYAIAVVILVAQNRMHSSDLLFGVVDLLLGTLFVIAYLGTPNRESPRTT